MVTKCDRWWCCAAALLLLSVSCATERSESVEISGATMGTYYRVTARCADLGLNADALGRIVDDRLAHVNSVASHYDPTSELSSLNAGAVDEWIAVSAPLQKLLTTAQTLHQLTRGRFDVTVAPLVDLWGFGPAETSSPPDSAQIERILQRIGSTHLEVTDGQARKHRAVQIDLSALAKGWGVDVVSKKLDELGCANHLVDIGGEVRARGVNAGGLPWRVGVEAPGPGAPKGMRVLSLADAAVATSGDYRNFRIYGDQTLSHFIDPATGRPVPRDVASVSVVHESAMWADGLATALAVLGADAAMELAEREGLPVLLIVRREPSSSAGFETGFEERYTASMTNYLVAP